MKIQGTAAAAAVKALAPVPADTIRVAGTTGGLKLSATNMNTNLRVTALVPMASPAVSGVWVVPRQAIDAWVKSGVDLGMEPGESTIKLSGDGFEAQVPFSTEAHGDHPPGSVGEWYDIDSKTITEAIRPCLWSVGDRVVRPALHSVRLVLERDRVVCEGVSGFSYTKSSVAIDVPGPAEPVELLLDAQDAVSITRVEFSKLGVWPDGDEVRGIRVRSNIADYEMRCISVDYPDLEEFIGPMVDGIEEEETWLDPQDLYRVTRTLVAAVPPVTGMPLEVKVSSSSDSMGFHCKGQWLAEAECELSGGPVEHDNRFKVGQIMQAASVMVSTSNVMVTDRVFVMRSEIDGIERTALLTCLAG